MINTDLTEFTGKLVGYARVSTEAQDLQPQLDALAKAGCTKIYEEKASGVLNARKRREEMLLWLRPGDTLVVCRLDRLGRGMVDLVMTIDKLTKRGIAFRSLQESFDTRTAAGKMILGMLALFAEFERNVISERTKAALITARAKGHRPGPKPLWEQKDKMQAAEAMLRNREPELSVAEVAKALKVGTRTLYDALEVRYPDGWQAELRGMDGLPLIDHMLQTENANSTSGGVAA